MAQGLALPGDPVLVSVTWGILWAERTSPHDRPALCKPSSLAGCLGSAQSRPTLGELSAIQGSDMEYQRHLDKC